jgi:hypothetical protein
MFTGKAVEPTRVKNLSGAPLWATGHTLVYDKAYSLIVDIYFYDHSKHLALALNSLDTLSDIRIEVFMLLF